MLLTGPYTNRKEPLCKGQFLWTLPKLHVLSEMEDVHMLPLYECRMHAYTVQYPLWSLSQSLRESASRPFLGILQWEMLSTSNGMLKQEYEVEDATQRIILP